METENLITQLESSYHRRSGEKNRRKELAWQAFMKNPWPKEKDPAFRYFPLRTLQKQPLSVAPLVTTSIAPTSYVDGALGSSYLTWVNGQFIPSASKLPPHVTALPLAEGERSYGEFFKKNALLWEEKETSPFAHLNQALYRDGLFLYIPPDKALTEPVQLLFITTNQGANAICLPRLAICCGKNSRGVFVSKICGKPNANSWTNGLIHLSIEKKGEITFVEQQLSEVDDWHFFSMRAALKASSALSFFTFSCGAQKALRRDLHIALLGQRAVAKVHGLDLLEQKHQAHTHILMEHEAENTHSDQQVKSVVRDHGRCAFSGKIFVGKHAQKTDAYQLNHNLLLGENGVAYSEPNLEVFADDVKASHGATCAKPCENEALYLRTRGLSGEDAENMIVRAFCREFFQKLPVTSVASRCEKVFS